MMNSILKMAIVAWLMLAYFGNMNELLAQGAPKTVEQWVALAISGKKDLVNANFTGANMEKVNLSGADLTGANLTGTNLSNAILTDCNLYHANLTGVNFTGANLSRANFLATNMQYVNLKNANLQQAMLQEANLQYAILSGANLQSANLLLADLKNADLQNSNLKNAMLDYTEAPAAGQTLAVPEIAETESLGKAMELLEKNINVFVRITGAKINKNTTGLDFMWARKNGAMMVAAQ